MKIGSRKVAKTQLIDKTLSSLITFFSSNILTPATVGLPRNKLDGIHPVF